MKSHQAGKLHEKSSVVVESQHQTYFRNNNENVNNFFISD